MAPPKSGLYVHIPWCVRKCPYCDFNSHAVRGEVNEAAYIKALLADLKDESQAVNELAISSIFIGGGTPSLFSAQAIGQLLEGAEKLVPFVDNIEDRPKFWRCWECKSEYPLNDDFYRNPLTIYFEEDLPEEIKEKIHPKMSSNAKLISFILIACFLAGFAFLFYMLLK